MKVGYLSIYQEKGYSGKVISLLSFDVLKRKDIKKELGLIMSDNEPDPYHITEKNVKTYQLFLKYFLKRDGLCISYSNAVKYGPRRENRDIIRIIAAAAKKEPIRIYIPFNKDKSQIRALNAQLKQNGIHATVEEIRREESPYSRLCELISACILFHSKLGELSMQTDKERILPVSEQQETLADYLMFSRKDKDKFSLVRIF